MVLIGLVALTSQASTATRMGARSESKKVSLFKIDVVGVGAAKADFIYEGLGGTRKPGDVLEEYAQQRSQGLSQRARLLLRVAWRPEPCKLTPRLDEFDHGRVRQHVIPKRRTAAMVPVLEAAEGG